MGQLGTIQETREILEVKVPLFSSDSQQDFRHALVDYCDFYDTKVKPELIHFTQLFKQTVLELTTFLCLESSDALPETI